MERIKELNRYQKGILLALITMIVVFGVIYSMVSSRVGFLYNDEILILIHDNGETIYTGEINGKTAEFSVTKDDCVTLRYGETVYGPYTVKENPDAVPLNDPRAKQMSGIVIKDGNKVLFQGGVLYINSDKSDFFLYTEDGLYSGVTIMATMSDGTVVDMNGNIVDTMKPTVRTILNLINGPELESKGEWIGYLGGILFSMMTAVTILFADELFRWKYLFQVRDADQIEPSDWALAERYIGWTIGVIGALVICLMGLR